MSGPYILLQYGGDAFKHRYQDLEGRPAFTVSEASRSPNIITRLTREAQWAQQHPSIMGPENSYFYFGPEMSIGHIAYGNNRSSIHMAHFLKQKRDGSTTRYFITQSGKEYKWRIGSHRMECMDGRNLLAIWEVSAPEDEHHARLTIKHTALPIVTEILTTLTLNNMAQTLGW